MGALSNSGRKAANLAGFYKAFQSGGAAVLWALDGRKLPYNTIFGITVRLLKNPYHPLPAPQGGAGHI